VVEDTFDLYKTLLVGMVAVFQIPTLVLFLAKNTHGDGQISLAAHQVCDSPHLHHRAVLTPSTDPWNQTVFAAPMIALYVISIGIAWLVQPKQEPESSSSVDSTKLRLVVGAMVVDHTRRHVARSTACRDTRTL